MPPKDGITIAHFLTVADVERSLRFYETVFGGRIDSKGDNSGAPGYIQIANTWLIVNPGGSPTPDKPTVILSVPADPDKVSSFMNIRVADIQACYKLWRSRGAEFITEPKPKYGETRCYIRDPDGYIIESDKATRASLTVERHDVMPSYDAIIIGAGQSGPALARRLVAAGRRVAIIERKLFGGTCVNTGCTPTKTLAASAYVAQ